MPRRTDAEMLALTAQNAPMECCKELSNLEVEVSEERFFCARCNACGRRHRRALMHDLTDEQRAAAANEFRIL